MRRSTMLAIATGVGLASPAGAYEFTLQFAPNGGARSLVVAGYAFLGKDVTGNCSYYVVTGGGSGRGGGYHSHTTYYNQTCTWDQFGNLLSVVPGAPSVPAPLSTSGSVTTYARNKLGDTTGTDSAHVPAGFVNTPSAQFAWVTQPSNVFLPNQNSTTVTLTLTSEGDFPLVVSKIEPMAQLAKTSVRSTTCKKPVKPGSTCSIVITYDPRGLLQGDDPYTAYDRLTVGIVSNSGQTSDFSESVEVAVSAGG